MDGVSALERFRAMARMRHFDEACLEGVPSGEVHGELHVGIGQEAIGAAMIGALREGDAVVSPHRNHHHAIAKGVPVGPMLAEIFEREGGLCRGRGGHMHLFDPGRNFSTTGIVGATLPVALGYAYAFWMEDSGNVAVAVTGEGGTNTGAFHECLNIAGAWKLPLVVLIENNSYAISVEMEKVSATPTVAERALAYAAWGRKVDGTDADNVSPAFEEAVEHARGGAGPAVLEATCYRFRGHFEGDHDMYRDDAEKERIRREYDPLVIARLKLIEGGADADELDAMIGESREEMRALLAEVREMPMPGADGALEHVYRG